MEAGSSFEIAADRPRVASLSVGARQSPAAHLAVDRKHLRIEGLDQRRKLRVAQLADVEMPALRADAPTEKQIGGRLHQPLALDHPLAVLGIGALAGIRLQYGGVGFLELQEEPVI